MVRLGDATGSPHGHLVLEVVKINVDTFNTLFISSFGMSRPLSPIHPAPTWDPSSMKDLYSGLVMGSSFGSANSHDSVNWLNLTDPCVSF